MIDVRCKVGDSLRIGDQGLVRVVSVEGNIVLLRVTAREQAWPESAASSRGVDDEYDFRHSE
jgi:hypothetical protein